MFLKVFLLCILLIIHIINKNFLYYDKCVINKHLQGKIILNLKIPGFYHLFNPSIIIQPQKYIIAARVSTISEKSLFYKYYGKLFYHSFLIFIIFNFSGNYKIIWSKSDYDYNNLEDPRLIEFQNKYIVVCTQYNQNHQEHFPKILVYSKNFNLDREIKINFENYLKKIQKYKIKNWCPFIHKNELYLHTDAYPMWKVFKLNYETGKLTKEVEQDIRLKFKIVNMYLRCSTSWKSYDSEYYICGLHIKTKQKYFPSIQSLLVLISKKTLLPEYKTDIFCLEPHSHDRIQFLSGLEIDDTHVILGYGVNDCEVKIKKIPRWKLKFKNINL
jgi:hypothetical protein